MGSWRVMGSGAVVAIATLSLGTTAAQAHREFDIGVGYTHVELDGSASPFDSRGGLRLEPRFSWAPGGDAPGSHLRLGVGLPMSGFDRTNDRDRVIIIDEDDGDTFILRSNETESLTFVTPEFQVSYRQMLGRGDFDGNRKWFVEPGIGVAVVVAQYWVGERFGWWTNTDISEWDATLAGRPFLRAGYQGDRWVLGLEASYLIGGSLDFTDEIGGDLHEWHVGVFFGGRW